jgi:hypothetical protein
MGPAPARQRWVVVVDDAPVGVRPCQVAAQPLACWGLAASGSTLYLESAEEEEEGGGGQALAALEALWYSTEIRCVARDDPAAPLPPGAPRPSPPPPPIPRPAPLAGPPESIPPRPHAG